MRSGAAADVDGIFHETSIFGSDAELRETALPFLSEGLDAQDPTYVVLGPRAESLVRREIGEPEGLYYIPAREAYVNPATTVKSYRDVCVAATTAGAEQVRFITEVPHPGFGTAWDWWGRYESAVNEIFADLPVWAICTYDERTTPTPVLDEVLRSHPYVAGPGGAHTSNRAFEPPSDFLARRSCLYTDPIEAGEPLVELVDPTLIEARSLASGIARAFLGAEAADNLALAVSEVVANAQRYGRPTVELRLWAAPNRVLASVQDRGPGIQDVTLGLAPVEPERTGGRGLWIANQLCDHLSICKRDDRFQVKLVVGTPHVAA